MGALVPLHPEAVDGDPATLRWVTTPGRLGFVGVPALVPEPVRGLLADGPLASLVVEPDAVRVTLRAGRTWRDEGESVRAALQEALAQPAGWQGADGGSPDDVLRMAVEQVIAGEVGDYVRGHGGRIALLDVTDGRVEVSLGGACAHCPATEATLAERVTTAVRARCPDVVEVVAREEPGSGRGLLRLLPTRRA